MRGLRGSGRSTKNKWWRLMGASALAGVMLVGSACSTTSGAKTLDGTPTAEERLELDPMLIRAGANGEGETIDVTEVFKMAYEAYSDRRYEKAAKHYVLVVEYFKDSKYYLPALYNAGLSYEKLERWQPAAKYYRQIIDEHPEEKDAKDAYYRLANAYEKMGEHQMVVELMTEVLLRKELSNFDRCEAYVRRSNSLLELEDWKEAEQGYTTMLELNEKAAATERLSDDSHLVVQAHFGLGRSYHERVRDIELVLPTERMGQDLEKKGELFTRAQLYYIEALRHHHPQWSMAAGYMIGKLYEDFYTDIFNAEIPDDLDREHVALYFEELQKHIRPLMERAVQVYEKNLSLSRRIGTSDEQNEWVAQTSQKLERLRHFLDDPITQRRAEMLVAHGHTVKTPWDPQATATDLVDIAVKQAAEEAHGESAAKLEKKAEGPDS
ncbi:tetratricopeptide repeat protein [Persicimonas caeni]|nr:tetratricopeptide repeat protein [Persicimonas caeni]